VLSAANDTAVLVMPSLCSHVLSLTQTLILYKKYVFLIVIQGKTYIYTNISGKFIKWINILDLKTSITQLSRNMYISTCGPGSSVGIATGYGLDGPGIESRWERDFSHLSRPALGPTQPPVKWVPCISRGKERPGLDADHSPPSSAVVKED